MRKYGVIPAAAKTMPSLAGRDRATLELVCIALAVALVILAARIFSVL